MHYKEGLTVKRIIQATLAVCLIVISILVVRNLHHTPTVGDRISYAIDDVCNEVSQGIQAIQYHFFSR